MEVTISKHYQITIPKVICKELNLKPGQKIDISRRGDKIIIDTRSVVDRLAGSLPGAWGKDPDKWLRRVRGQ